MCRQHCFLNSIVLTHAGGTCGLRGLSLSNFPACDRAKKTQIMRKQVRGESWGVNAQWWEERGGGGENKLNAQRTIQCESFGNPCTAAGPKARAVFIPAPVYGTANL